ncbi:MAG TPA: DPP IV N-terminal domain-containing protein [Candidatus Sulfopaludibacter sp.]|jgi:dipeptidyl aminopeptidase/acylaminoacyl peptidase|nr:DPP IV N-terminal domain-containing protein [Candidatus Sulfopaludibacter sp.]
MKLVLVWTTLFCSLAAAQGRLADYQRAHDLETKAKDLVVHSPGTPTWIGTSGHFWYARTVVGGSEFMLVDAATGLKKPAFDHEKLAAAISQATHGKFTAVTLPFLAGQGRRGATGAGGAVAGTLTFLDNESAIQFGNAGFLWKCSLTDYTCTKGDALPAAPGGRGARGGAPLDESLDPPLEIGGDPVDGLAYEAPAPQQDSAAARGFGRGQTGCAPRGQNPGRGGRGAAAGATPAEPQVCASFDGKWEALIENYNIFLKQAGSTEPAKPLSFDGSEGNYYTFRSIAWSPDSTKLAAYHTRPGYDRQVHYIESSPTDQVQPKHSTMFYRKPGDALDVAYPALFDIATGKEVEIDHELFPNPYNITSPVWWHDSRGFTFEYNQRGHQVYRVIEVDAQTGKTRTVIDEQSKTFIYYNELGPGLSGGRRYRHDLHDGAEIIWASERDGWEHLYLYDGVTGKVKNQITTGDWLVRNVVRVDDDKRQIWFEAGGLIPGQDPYFTQYCRINFDGTGLTRLTDADGNHTVTFSPDQQYYVDSWSRVDLPPVAQLRRTGDQKVIADLEKADASALLKAGIRFPEVFVAKGRDGKTDIWGVIIRPANFDPAKKYPVIENIYAGPQGSFVPKTFSAFTSDQAMAELGFIIVHIDGMGTSNRSKAFHDVAWKNLGDAGFPDRILWHKAAAAKYPWYDLNRVGIFGTSAGGQNSLGGMLFHPDFYKVVVTNSGCHDNRMDKIWWNEQWMGWPVGPQYAASSNVDNAFRLQGKALIIVGEMDSNVDPASSLQVVNALVKAKKHFDMLFIPGQNHGVGVLATQHYRDDYFVHHLLGVEPPDWNKVSVSGIE